LARGQTNAGVHGKAHQVTTTQSSDLHDADAADESSLLSRAVQFFASKTPLTLAIWACLVIFGTLSYLTLMPREGFPPVDAPFALASGTYFVDDPERVDRDIAQPLADAAAALPEVIAVSSTARANSFTVGVELDSAFTSVEGAAALEKAGLAAGLPAEANIFVTSLDVARFLNEYELLVGVSGDPGTSAADLQTAATKLLPMFEGRADIAAAEVVDLIETGVNPATGEQVSQETDFNQITSVGGNVVRPSIAIGVKAAEGVDSIGIRDATDIVLDDAEAQGAVPAGFTAEVAIDAATQIRGQIGSLQQNVITGIIAVAIVALLLISWRASVITALFIFTVMATSFGVLHLLGISLNTISLFGVIIALGLFVDDAIVITEAIDAFREGGRSPLQIIGHAIRRVGAASISGTVTTVLVFAPMLAITGILGDFVRILPISVIVALISSLVLSLIFIPFASRFLVLSAPPSKGILTRGIDAAARVIGRLPGTRGRAGVAIGAAGILLSIVMTFVGLFVFAPRVGFNIFPPQKDSDFAQVEFSFPPGTSIEEAKAISSAVNQEVVDALGDDVKQAYTFVGNSRNAFTQFVLSDMGSRDKAPDLVENVLQPIGDRTEGARVAFSVISGGPPEALFPFLMQVYGDDPAVLNNAAQELQAALDGAEIARPNGTTFNVIETDLVLTDSVARADGRRYVEVQARFDADDVTTTTSETQAFIEAAFGPDALASLGLEADSVEFDFGLETDNQESFASMPFAFGIALLLMLVLLLIQFRSSVQWLLVFLAIPFSFFGVFGGLLLTNNQISFFVMLGLLGLIGIAVNNTILLTDFANQERRAGADRKSAIETAMRRRFRPLVATSLTTVAGVLPLALSDPFWESLGFTIIFGLLSSTFLVLLSFPYYYLAVEWLRDRIRTPWRSGPKPGPLVESSQKDPLPAH